MCLVLIRVCKIACVDRCVSALLSVKIMMARVITSTDVGLVFNCGEIGIISSRIYRYIYRLVFYLDSRRSVSTETMISVLAITPFAHPRSREVNAIRPIKTYCCLAL